MFGLVVSKALLHDGSSLFEQNIKEAGVCGHKESNSPHGIRKQRVEGLGIRFFFKDLPITTYFLQMGDLLKSQRAPKAVPPAGE